MSLACDARDRLALGLFALLALVVWWPTRDLPYFWDAAGFVLPAARDMAARGFWPLVPAHEFYAHPPLFVAMVALAFRLFGESRAVAHLVVLPFAFLAMAATYVAGRRLGDRVTGVLAAALVGATAVEASETAQVYFDLPAAALATCALAAWVTRRPIASGVLLALALWTKLTVLPLLGALAIALILDPERRRAWRWWLAVAIPVGATLAWLVYHHSVDGFWLASSSSWGARSSEALPSRAWTAIRGVFVDQYRWAVSALAICATVGLLVQRRTFPRGLAPLVACVAIGVVFFTPNDFMPRYALALFPSLYLVALLLARSASRQGWHFAAVGSVIAGAFLCAWHPRLPTTDRYELMPPQDLSYEDMIHVALDLGSFLEHEHPQAEIYGGFHEHYELGDADDGYVSRPLDVHPCDRFQRDRAEQLVIIHDYAPNQPICRLVAEKTHATALRRFESNGKWLEVWRVPPP